MNLSINKGLGGGGTLEGCGSCGLDERYLEEIEAVKTSSGIFNRVCSELLEVESSLNQSTLSDLAPVAKGKSKFEQRVICCVGIPMRRH